MWVDIEQNTDEWLKLRAGKITSSNLSCVMANAPKAFGDPANKYAARIAVEQVNGEAIPSDYSNAHMDRGHEQEPLARIAYEREYFVEITNGGIYVNGDRSSSPDGLVGADGQVEIKSVIPHIHLKTLKRDNIDPTYKWQIWDQLRASEREWIDFVSFSPLVKSKPLFVHRVRAEDCADRFNEIDERVLRFRELISDYKKLIQVAA